MTKKKLDAIIIAFIFLVMLLPGLPALFAGISSDENDYARITDVEYKAVVVDEPDSEGKVIITERLTFDVHAAFRSLYSSYCSLGIGTNFI